jgi:hypothetical protein
VKLFVPLVVATVPRKLLFASTTAGLPEIVTVPGSLSVPAITIGPPGA